MKFPVILTPDEDGSGVVVTFLDIPEAITQGETVEEALAMAQEALETAMEFYFEDKRAVPMPSKPKPGQRVVELPVSLSAKVLLLKDGLHNSCGRAASIFGWWARRGSQPRLAAWARDTTTPNAKNARSPMGLRGLGSSFV